MVAVEVLLTLLRELLRTLGTPLRLLAYLPRRHYWRRVSKEVLEAAATTDPQTTTDAAVRERLLARLQARRGRRAGPPRLFVSAGEASGEAHAARLCRALPAGTQITAFGGAPLQAAGARVLFPLSEHAVMGFLSVLAQLPLILRAYATFLRLLRDDPPDLVVLVDYPGLHLVMAKACRRRGVPVLHYVAPQYWAWGPWRMRRYRRSVDATLTILPFETGFFARFHVPAHYIGHPLLDQLAQHAPEPPAVAAIAARPTLCLLPGSRRREILANLPGMLQVARAIRAASPDTRVVLPHRDARRAATIQELLAAHGGDFVEFHHGDLAPWLAGARLVLAKSGTGSLEACLHGNPVIVVYRLRGWLATLGYHNILSVPFIAAANLVAARTVVPEFCFHGDDGWQRVQDSAMELWTDAGAAQRCRDGLRAVRTRLGAAGATARVAAIVGSVLAAVEAPR